MIELKRKIIIIGVCLFTLISAATTAKPLCIRWFYQPEVPEILKGPIKKKKGVV
ncbi:MAG: hypothetical protein PWR06_770 [Thermoanaerobacteraceae bacterium]|jgi:cyclic lactone autoinducer peptide|uniref:Cyclic lactone autoinducer peptide n=1 Tax=Biomaibacter acetigenes TaxID=2316383 RepID=A0A3G2R3Z2_9FIRM|nr:cyclic lactone autoinducer peptide [Biomaibacter acetigenes]AYO30156.1 cyclic lactone autoinducer peptide [Biomaibacter acetigenes]MDK2878054.1 hypothetical protein [Thermoanaerobacteraceae bacterium]MDN5301570.1 hypothetical protein [Thermoanaerobacteraceae bacterium]RKL62204.1 cyclic lactone autoinducer peptide [Thermoanaerobacteraceae bacterium SP2]